MSYPAGNTNWAWKWMGFSAPNTCYNNKPLKDGYHEFRNCFGTYYGIGDFDYWKRNELQKLSDEDKVELIKLLIADNKEKTEVRKYLGLNLDGTINKNIDEFADSRTMFFAKLTIEECRKQKYPHNQRCRYKHGFQCDDCGTFIHKDSEEYLRTEVLSDYLMSIHNIGVCFHRENIELPEDFIELEKQFENLDRQNCYSIPIDEIQAMISNYNTIKKKYQLN